MFVKRLKTSKHASILLERILRVLLLIKKVWCIFFFNNVYQRQHIYNEIVSLLEQAKEPVLKECLQICKENYDGSIDDATTSIENFDANNGLVTCEVTFNEPPVRKFPIKSESDDLMNFIGIILSLLKQFEINL
ncbi:hypothetical protein H5410_047142 [Solanum commersonii]|uniref:Uncharacterized protein n=1 Tax=Solanum commersonii TaxID=4109 RepID=A0A9J5XHG0_SOLCO|nr:hypothetical protein H5410_047142 [Solanum commersonii]